MKFTRQLCQFFQMSMEVYRETGKAPWVQLGESLRLRFSRSKLSLAEYFDYRVYRHSNVREQKSFVGWRMADRLQRALTSSKWFLAASDKAVFYALCDSFKLPHPELRALYVSPQTRYAGRIPTFWSLDDVRTFLSSPEAHLPLWVKPIRSWNGLGGRGIAAFDSRTDSVTLTNGAHVQLPVLLGPVTGLLEPGMSKEDLSSHWPGGYLFQKLLTPHKELARRCGNRICTLRLSVLIEREGPRIVDALWRVAIGKNMVDNYRHGQTGNSFGPIDIDTGVVLRQALQAGFREQEIRLHPDTGEEIVGFRLPDWNIARDLCLYASLCFGGFRLQAWDVALTDHGPVLVELNCPADISLPQFASRRGIWDSSVDRILDELGVSP
ncbi:MAG: hypothetical protein E6K69_05100 [Nitrospirae bacterium]|nr:MAG: hypothetical protein E6K69_05100 [Nitrospirota bacterium]